MAKNSIHNIPYTILQQPVTDNNLVPSTANAQLCQIRRKCKNRFIDNEREKKRLHNKRILEVEHARFIALIFTIHGAMGIECRSFVSKLCKFLAIKRDLPMFNAMGENEN